MTRIMLALAVFMTLGAAAPAIARCWDTGHSIRCAPGCELLKRPRFRGDIFTWRCRRYDPQPQQQYAPPPPRYQPAPDGCGPGMYAATPTWCCPFGTFYESGRCLSPQEPRIYQASAPDDPTPFLLFLAVIALSILAWLDSLNRQAAYARETAEVLEDTEEIAAATARIQDAADEADEILRKFRDKLDDDE